MPFRPDGLFLFLRRASLLSAPRALLRDTLLFLDLALEPGVRRRYRRSGQARVFLDRLLLGPDTRFEQRIPAVLRIACLRLISSSCAFGLLCSSRSA